MPKTLRITFSGICTLAPGYPRAGEAAPTEVFVLMAAARTARASADGQGAISRHSPFLYVPRANLIPMLPTADPREPVVFRLPDFAVNDVNHGTCDVFLFDRADVRFDEAATPPVTYHVTGAVIDERPDSDEEKPDVRWLPDLRDILPDARLDPAIDPRVSNPVDTDKVAAVVRFTRGIITANFPCEPAALQEIPLPGGSVLRRTFACEFIVTMEYPDTTQRILLQINRISGNAQPDVMLKWGDSDVIHVRMGNDTLDEIVRLAKDDCTPPAIIETDHDFELHYSISTNVPAGPPPLPKLPSGGEFRFNGCLGLMTG